jgi:hypothetical protein
MLVDRFDLWFRQFGLLAFWWVYEFEKFVWFLSRHPGGVGNGRESRGAMAREAGGRKGGEEHARHGSGIGWQEESYDSQRFTYLKYDDAANTIGEASVEVAEARLARRAWASPGGRQGDERSNGRGAGSVW